VNPVVPVESVRSRADRFRCEPYRCELTADHCLKRQAKALAATSLAEKLETSKCRGCEVGALVSQNVGGEPPVAATPPPTQADVNRRAIEKRAAAARLRAAMEARAQRLGAQKAAAPKSEPQEDTVPKQTEPTAATCNHPDGCDEPVGQVRSNTRPEHAGFCVDHRKQARWQKTPGATRPAAKAEPPVRVPARVEPPPVRVPARPKPTPTAPEAPARATVRLRVVTLEVEGDLSGEALGRIDAALRGLAGDPR
jgi:hypothetical protein